RNLLYISLALILFGGLLANLIQTDFGKVTIKDVRFAAPNGRMYSALLYIPEGVTAEKPAPGIMAIHGYINTRETQDGFAIEFARRGFVVLALDQSGHGYSEGPAFADGFGGIEGMRYLKSLTIVDQNNVGLEGHSMGGWASVIAAAVFPDGYKAMVLEGSSTGTYGAPDGTPEFPRNLAVVFSQWDEFSELMWLSPKATDAGKTDKMKALFNTTEDIEVGKVYGDIAAGTARVLYQPKVVHPGDHINQGAIGYAVDWFQKTLDGEKDIPADQQTWYWKEIGTLIAMIGFFLFLVAAGGLLLTTAGFSTLIEPLPAAKGPVGIGWWITVVLTMIIGPLTLFTFKGWAETSFPASAAFPQAVTNQVVFWAVLNGLITLVLFLVWHFLLVKRNARGNADEYGLTWDGRLLWGKIGKSFLLALTVVALGYATLVLTDFFFKTDYRFWVFAVKLPNLQQFGIALRYVIPLFVYFFLASMALFAQIRRANLNIWQEMGVNAAIFAVAYLGLQLVQYIPMWTGGMLMNPAEPLWTIIGYQFIPILGLAGALTTFFYRATGRIYTGAFLNAMLFTMIVVTGTAIHFAL
ncbi:MAG TPA: alpha/beta fold hydrolase, partial [Anaerolineaceae bacterium]|nr:alpha/beta fold hydrolase [Anaerolineaceae bacterium]